MRVWVANCSCLLLTPPPLFKSGSEDGTAGISCEGRIIDASRARRSRKLLVILRKQRSGNRAHTANAAGISRFQSRVRAGLVRKFLEPVLYIMAKPSRTVTIRSFQPNRPFYVVAFDQPSMLPRPIPEAFPI